MDTYLVGGAVRDRLLGLTVRERDWVVVGTTPEEMMDQGFEPVGQSFPVFLHPTTHEEYALARTERKVAPGYTGFVFHADPNVTLEDDLKRRDLTINAIAQNKDGELIDPYGGRVDLVNKVFRHVSEAFCEDPVRVLRVARFSARFPEFTVHASTRDLMREMVRSGELDALVPERVWKECSRALMQDAPWRFFDVLADVGAMPLLFPMLQALPCRQALARAAAVGAALPVRFALVCRHLKAKEIEDLVERYHIPNACSELASMGLLIPSYRDCWQHKNPTLMARCLSALDAWRRPGRLASFQLLVRLSYPKHRMRDDQQVLELIETAQATIDASQWVEQGIPGKEIGERIKRAREELIRQYMGI